MTVHIISVGTSVLRNYAREEGAEELLELEKGSKRLEELNVDIDGLLNFIDKDPRKASAELNAFLGAIEECPADKVVLLCTDTEAGELSCYVLKRYLELKGYSVSAYVIQELGRSETFYEGLVNMMCAFPKIVNKEVGDERMCVNPTGGFKPESAVLYMLSLTDKRTDAVYYVHEAFREVVFLPIFPVIKTPLELFEAKEIKWVKSNMLEKLVKCWNDRALTPWRPLRIQL